MLSENLCNTLRTIRIGLLLLFSLFLSSGCFGPGRLTLDPTANITGPVWDSQKRVWVYTVESEYLDGENKIEVVLPNDDREERTCRVLYVLPVEAGIGGHYGDGLQEILKLDAHNRYGLIAVQMAFDTLPWYADHSGDPRIRHESYIKNIVVPLIESRYNVQRNPEGRLLFGYSKSGWGAFTLMMRNPELFGYAVSWDAPLMLERWKVSWRMDRHFGTVPNFDRYRPAKLFETHAAPFRQKERLLLLGSKNLNDETVRAHRRMTELGIRHYYDNTIVVDHHWNSGWVEPALEALMDLVQE